MPETTAVKHSDECMALYNASVEKRRAWRALWLEACVDCRGTGLMLDGLGECLSCLANGTCPRCDSQEAIVGLEAPSCMNCGWSRSAPDAYEPRLATCLGPPHCQEVPRG
jgi:hypothetical protein